MYPPSPELHYYDYALFGAAEIGATAIGATGITLAGVLKAETGKLEALPPGVLEKTIPAYDLVLLEGDGSRGLPLKGWADHEPVVPPCTTLTIALIPISVLGQKISGETVFRLPQFLALCGAGEGDRISIAHLAALIRGGQGALNGGTARGLLSAARGKKLLFINQAEGRWDEARELAASLPADLSAGLEGIICGSVEQDRVEILR
jgi:probable selenium-dependent hydroxylase accessory protein YqeC